MYLAVVWIVSDWYYWLYIGSLVGSIALSCHSCCREHGVDVVLFTLDLMLQLCYPGNNMDTSLRSILKVWRGACTTRLVLDRTRLNCTQRVRKNLWLSRGRFL